MSTDPFPWGSILASPFPRATSLWQRWWLLTLQSHVILFQFWPLLIQFTSWKSGGEPTAREQPAPRAPPAAGLRASTWGCCHGCKGNAAPSGKAANLFFGPRHSFGFYRGGGREAGLRTAGCLPAGACREAVCIYGCEQEVRLGWEEQHEGVGEGEAASCNGLHLAQNHLRT